MVMNDGPARRSQNMAFTGLDIVLVSLVHFDSLCNMMERYPMDQATQTMAKMCLELHKKEICLLVKTSSKS
jgi:hypothetical protein